MSLTRFLSNDEPPITMDPDDTVMDAINKMVDAGIGSVLIQRGEGAVDGIFSERDLMIRVARLGIDPTQTLLRDVMTRNVIVLPRSATLDQAIAIMAKHEIHHLPIVEESGKLAGVLSLKNLLHDKIDEVVKELNVLEDFDDHVRGG